jgi:signal transduction histidine kinase
LSGNLFVDWGALALSFFNTIILIWLGMTVLLNAERRTAGVILAAEGLLTGAAFFIAHSVILAQGALSLLRNYDFWWHVGWLPVIFSPFAWYLVVLWYSGFWDGRNSPLYKRHFSWVAGIFLLTIGLIGILLLAQPLLSISIIYETNQAVRQGLGLGYIPFLVLFYPLDIVLVIILSLDALIHPAPSGKVTGEIARRRARPWLIGSSLILLIVGLAVGATLFYLLQTVRSPDFNFPDLITNLTHPLSLIDLFLEFLVTAAILTIGQAAATYEIFTGKILPRRGILGEWRKVIFFAACFSLVMAACVVYQVREIYTMVIILLMMTFFYAAMSWRTMKERERSMRDLRPFVNSQKILDQVLESGESLHGILDIQTPFDALCRDILESRQAALVPLGTLAGLVFQPLYYPSEQPFELPPSQVLSAFSSPETMGVPLEAERNHGAAWILPLWNEAGLTGVIVLGEKNRGGFYSQEEIEIARAAGERLTDILATVELSRRLLVLQRQRLAQSQVLDRQTGRILHDEVLPRLHTALLKLSAVSYPANNEIVESLSETHKMISALLRELPPPGAPDLTQYGLVGAIRHLVNNEMGQSFDQVSWQIDARAESLAGELPPFVTEVMFYAAREILRNAAQHARSKIPNRPLSLAVTLTSSDALALAIEDNGQGIGKSSSTSHSSGQGLALHSTMMTVIGGTLILESVTGEFTRVTLHLPFIK